MTESYVFEPYEPASVAVLGGARFPVRRIFCIGQNYAEHVRELGGDPEKTGPVFFTKPADAVADSGSVIYYPSATDNLHYEGELVVALKGGGRNIPSAEVAEALIFGYAAGCDLTRRDLQNRAKAEGGPWDAAKGFDYSAPVGPIRRYEECGSLDEARLTLSVNGEKRQDSPLSDMIYPVAGIISALSELFELRAGDLVFTGTPSGVGPLAPGDAARVVIDGLEPLDFEIAR